MNEDTHTSPWDVFKYIYMTLHILILVSVFLNIQKSSLLKIYPKSIFPTLPDFQCTSVLSYKIDVRVFNETSLYNSPAMDFPHNFYASNLISWNNFYDLNLSIFPFFSSSIFKLKLINLGNKHRRFLLLDIKSIKDM